MYSYDENVNRKINRFRNILGKVLRTKKEKIRKETVVKFCKVVTVAMPLYDSEAWVAKVEARFITQATEMERLQ
jgi:hypothetical protein